MKKWSKPAYTDRRFGFELTLYILNRYGSGIFSGASAREPLNPLLG
jgi:coenzyme PQQ precursor peptide PqqA